MFNFKHKNTEFFDLFVDSAKYFYKGALIMEEVMLDSTKAVAKMKEIIDLEHEDLASDQKDGKHDAQNVHDPEPFMHDQRNVGNAERQRKQGDEGERVYHIIVPRALQQA